MNHTYRSVFNAITGAWVAVAETAKARGKASRRARPLAPLLAVALASPALAAPPAATQLPTGGQVVAGQASLGQSGAAMTVTQASKRAVIDWQSFNVGSQARVDFVQPSAAAVTLNRVLDTQPSQIFGRINANGQVFLSNPSGVYFSPSAAVDVGGLVATTHAISTADFMAGINTFRRNGSRASVINEGSLQAGLDGYIALLAPEVRNLGVIVARAGTVALAAGEAITLQLAGAATRVTVSPSEIAALVENRQAVLAPGGQVILSALAANRLQGGVVRNTGTLEAVGLVSDGGRIELIASDEIDHSGRIAADAAPGSVGRGGRVTLIADLANSASMLRVDGTLSTLSARGGEAGGDGGFVETSASRVRIGDGVRVDTRAPQGRAGSWLIDPDGFTIAASGGDISGATLSGQLANGDVSIASTAGGGSDGHIQVNDAVSWSSNTLTLAATNDVRINAVMTASGTASLDLRPGSGKVLTGFDDAGNFAGRVDFPGRSGTGFLTINGLPYTVINALGAQGSVTGLDLQGIRGNLSGHYALGGNIDASITSGWNGGAGFQPISDWVTSFPREFSGVFDGLGHTIDSLNIHAPATYPYLGLFGRTNGASFRNVGLSNASVSGFGEVGILVGQMTGGTIQNSYTSGSVTGTTGTGFASNIGGLIGTGFGLTVDQSHASAAVSSSKSGSVGGLIGYLSGSTVTNSSASGSVSATGIGNVAGLIAYLDASTVSNSSASGSITATAAYTEVGGLIGLAQQATVGSSHASGNVSAGGNFSDAGGLVGFSDGSGGSGLSLSTSYALGGVTATGNGANAGGLIGNVNSVTTISRSFASGAVSATGTSSTAGGLLGIFSGVFGPVTLSDGFASGSVNASASSAVGGLIGTIDGISGSTATVANTYARGAISGGDPVRKGGLAGSNSGSITSSFFDTTTSGQSALVGQNTGSVDAVSRGMDTGAMTTQANFVAAGWDFTLPTWRMGAGANGGYPCLSFAPGCVASAVTTLYVREAQTSGIYGSPSLSWQLVDASGNPVTPTDATVAGSASWSGAPTASSPVGIYNVQYASGLSLTGSGVANYLLAPWVSPISYTINPLPLILTGSRAYDGSTTATAGVLGIANAVAGNVPTLSGSVTLAGRNVGMQGISDFGSLSVSSPDYTLAGASGSVSITPKALTLTAPSVTKTYDGTTAFTTSPGVLASLSSQLGGTGDSVSAATLRSLSPNAGSASVALDAVTLNDGNGGANYRVTRAGNTTSGITKAQLTVTADNQSRLYGQPNPQFTQTVSGFVNGEDAASAGLTGSASGSSSATTTTGVGTAAITAGTGSLSAANYDFTPANGTLTITKAHLTVTANNQSRLYGQPNPQFTQTVSGFVNGEDAASAGLTGSATGISSATATTGVGTVAITGSTGSLSAANYDFTPANGTLTINKAHLTVTADNQSRLYGQPNPLFTQTVSGFVNGEDAASAGLTGSASGSSSATATTGVGTAAITASTGSLSAANYDFTPANGTLTINKAHLTVTANNQSRLYGQPNPVFTATLSGFVNGESAGSAGVTGLADVGSAATPLSAAGTAPITVAAGSLAAANYDFATFLAGTLTILPPPTSLPPVVPVSTARAAPPVLPPAWPMSLPARAPALTVAPPPGQTLAGDTGGDTVGTGMSVAAAFSAASNTLSASPVGEKADASGRTGKEQPDQGAVPGTRAVTSRKTAATATANGASQAGAQSPRFAAFLAAETARRETRTGLYRDALDILRQNPAAADVSGCARTSSEVCVPDPLESREAGNGIRRKTAVLFGNNAYTGNIPALQTPVGDVEAIGSVLRERHGYEVSVVRDASKRDMILALKKIAETAGLEDSVVVMYAGHGYELDDIRQGFWLPVDANEKNPATWVSNSDIARLLNANPARQILLVSDSCFSGTLTHETKVENRGEGAEDILHRRSVLALSSGGEEPVSDEGLGGNSIFAHHLIRTLGQVDKQFTASQIHRMVKEEVEKDFPQEPQLGGLLSAGHTPGGDFLFRKN